MIKGLKFKQKSAAAFGSYGWSGEAVKMITEDLGKCGFKVLNDGLRITWVPDEEQTKACVEFGKQFVAELAQN